MPTTTPATMPEPPSTQVACPACGTLFDWPPRGRCTRCGVALDGETAARFFDLSREIAALTARQGRVREELIRTAPPPAPTAVQPDHPDRMQAVRQATSQPVRRGLDDLGVQTLLGLAGAALLTVAAVVFAAVTWQQLSDLTRAAILVGATGIAAATAVALDRRKLESTGGAVGLVAAGLAGTLGWAAHQYGLLGRLSDTAGASIALLTATGMALVLGRSRLRYQAPAATTGWLGAVAMATAAILEVASPPWAAPILLGAAVLSAVPSLVTSHDGLRTIHRLAGGGWLASTAVTAAVTLASTDGAATIVPLLAGSVAAALWWYATPRPAGPALSTATLTGLALGGAATFDPTNATMAVMVATIGLLAAGAVWLVPEELRRPVAVGTIPATLPAALLVLGALATVAAGWFGSVGAIWRPGDAPTPLSDQALAVAALLGLAAAGVLLTRLVGTRAVEALVVLVPAGLVGPAWLAGVSGPVHAALAVAMGLVAVAWFTHLGRLGLARTTGMGWFVIGVGWSLPDPALAAGLAGTTTVAGLTAAWTPLRRHPEQTGTAIVGAALAAASLVVALTDPATAAQYAAPAALIAAAAIAGVGGRLRLDGDLLAGSWMAVALVATLATYAATDVRWAAVTTAVTAVGSVGLAAAWHADRTTSTTFGAVAAVAATLTSWLLLVDAGVTVVEAYTAVPAFLALVAGTVWLVRDPTMRSRHALNPGLALALGPTAVQLVGDPQDTWRAVATAGLAAMALLVGAGLRVEAPIWWGANATVVVVLTQLAVVTGHLPRWVVFAVAGTILVVASATFERQRARVRRLRVRARRLTETYR